MFALSETHKYNLYSGPVDMRKGFDGLCGIVQNQLDVSPTNGEVFIFFNKGRNKVKLLHWVGSGFVLYYKRLEKGTFCIPDYDIKQGNIKLDYSQLVMLVDGISITNIQKKKQYHLGVQ